MSSPQINGLSSVRARRGGGAAALAASILILAACSSDGRAATVTTTPGSTNGATTTAAPGTTAPATTITTVAAPKVGGTLVFRLAGEPPTLDPQKSNDPQMWYALLYTGGSLVYRNPASGDLQPALATKWTASADGLSYTFTLRDGVKFQNGDPLTAADYAFTVMRAIDPATKSPVSGTIFKGVTAATAPDTNTLVLTLSAPNAALLQNLSDPVFAMPLDEKYVKATSPEKLARAPIGVGPYQITDWQTGSKIVLTRNPDYTWGPDPTEPGPALVQTIDMPFVPTYATAEAGLEAGDIDVLGLQSKDVDRLKADSKYVVSSSLASGVDPVVHLNLSKPPFDQQPVRTALNLAVDRAAIVKVVALGQADIQQGPLSPSVAGYDAAASTPGYPFDTKAAKAALEGDGYTLKGGVYEKGGASLTFTLLYDSANDERRRLAEVLQQMWGDVGVKVTIEGQEAGVFSANVVGGKYQMAIDGWSWPDSSLLYGMFHSSMIGALNESQAKDPALDAILQTMFTAKTAEANQKAASEAQTYIVDHALLVPFFTKRNYVGINARVHGIHVSELTGQLDILAISIDS